MPGAPGPPFRSEWRLREPHPGFAARCGHSVCRIRSSQGIRLRALSAEDPRCRAHLDRHSDLNGAYVSRILASQHDAGTAYAAFDRHKASDFAPYLLKTTDAGRTWTAIQSDLPANGPVLAIAEDHVNPRLLFAGTEFGLFFTIDGGKKWIQLKGGMPTIAVRDLAIQKRMNDLVVGPFGRGISVLDEDYLVLSTVHSAKGLEWDAVHLIAEWTVLSTR